jgi:hypothetical protein
MTTREMEKFRGFLKGDKLEKAARFDEMLNMSNSLFDELKSVLATDNKEEKKRVLKKFKFLRRLMMAYFESVKTKLNLKPKELEMMIGQILARSPEYREKIASAKLKLDEHKSDLKKIIRPVKKGRMGPQRKLWIRS